MEPTKPNARELSVIEYLAALDVQLCGRQDVLRERLARIPNGWRDYRLIVMQTSRLLEKIYSTLPIKTLKRMEGICRNGEIVIRLRPPCSIPDHVLVNEDDMRRLINCAMAAECAICLRDGREIDTCPLRKVLESIVPPEEYSALGCSYRNIAISNEYGKYI